MCMKEDNPGQKNINDHQFKGDNLMPLIVILFSNYYKDYVSLMEN